MIELNIKERKLLKSLERESLRAVVLNANLEESRELIENAIRRMRKSWRKRIDFSDDVKVS